jgi:hypothetical protein
MTAGLPPSFRMMPNVHWMPYFDKTPMILVYVHPEKLVKPLLRSRGLHSAPPDPQTIGSPSPELLSNKGTLPSDSVLRFIPCK